MLDYLARPFQSQQYEVIVDMRACEYIKDNLEHLEMRGLYDENRPSGQKVVDCKAEPMLLLNFFSGFKRMKGSKWGKRIDTYSQNKNNPRRMTTSGTSLQGCPRDVRHTLCHENMVDFDIVNCHPILVENWCRSKGIACEHIESFNANRTERFGDVSRVMGWKKDETKTYMLRLTNGGGLRGFNNEDILLRLGDALDWFNPFVTQLGLIRKRVIDIYPELMKKAIKAKGVSYYNLDGVTISYLLTNLENQILQMLVNGCIKKKVKISALIYDGFMAYKDTVVNKEELCQFLEEEVKSACGYIVKIVEKEMTEDIPIPDEYMTSWELEEEAKQNEKEAKRIQREEEEEEKQRVKQRDKEAKELQREAEKQRGEEEKQRQKQREEEEKELKRMQREAEKQRGEEEKQRQKDEEKQRKKEQREAEKQREEEEKQRKTEQQREAKEEKRREKEREEAILYEYKLEQRELKKQAKQQEKEEKKDEEKTDAELVEQFLEEYKGSIVYNKRVGVGYFYVEKTKLWLQFNTFEALGDSMMNYLGVQQAKQVRNVIYIIKMRLMNNDDDVSRFNMKEGIIALDDFHVYDMRVGKKRERVKEDYCSFFLKRTFNENYDKEWVNTYIGELLCPAGKIDKALVSQFLELLGYVFTGENNLKYILMFIGRGDNGKSLLLDCVMKLLEQYAVSGNQKIFKKSRFDSDTHEAHLYPLMNCRATFISEMDDKDEFNCKLLKAISGNDEISIRNSGSPMTHSVTLKTVVLAATNVVPRYEDETFSNRLCCINFPNKFARDDGKAQTIKSHINDLFCAILEGATRYYKNNKRIVLVKSIKDYTTEVKEEKNPFIQFIKNNRYEKKDGAKLLCADMYTAYVDDLRKNKYEPKGKEKFYLEVEKHFGITKKRINKGNIYEIVSTEPDAEPLVEQKDDEKKED